METKYGSCENFQGFRRVLHRKRDVKNRLFILRKRIDNKVVGGYNYKVRGSAGIGRQARLRGVCASVWVQVPSAAPRKNHPDRMVFTFFYAVFMRLRIDCPAEIKRICLVSSQGHIKKTVFQFFSYMILCRYRRRRTIPVSNNSAIKLS